jgi:hypothetical protein
MSQQEKSRTCSVTLSCVFTTTVAVGRAVSITQLWCVFVALGIQHAMHMRHTVNCGLPEYTIFFPIIPRKARLSKNKSY